ncbi:hypothetical protein ANN_17914 [Periplaneta americana]|uniref:Uncharacterized protein n=1 Tax=Periplaneta americana TaxID=6978 RepID=A0ABQ8SN94_PERAM|nr:hypothetical protein ANN_17914 [Periplaneta americana]
MYDTRACNSTGYLKKDEFVKYAKDLYVEQEVRTTLLRNVDRCYSLSNHGANQWMTQEPDTKICNGAAGMSEICFSKAMMKFLSGHGTFGSYFERFKRETEGGNICACDDSLQTVQHLLFECHKFELQRLELVCRLNRLRENPGENLNQVTYPDRDSNPGHLISQPDALTVTPQLLEDILFIDSNFKIVSKSIILLESSKLQLSEVLNIVDKVSQTVIQNNNSLISEKVKCKLRKIIAKNYGYSQLRIINDVLSGLSDIFVDEFGFQDIANAPFGLGDFMPHHTQGQSRVFRSADMFKKQQCCNIAHVPPSKRAKTTFSECTKEVTENSPENAKKRPIKRFVDGSRAVFTTPYSSVAVKMHRVLHSECHTREPSNVMVLESNGIVICVTRAVC